MNTRQPLIPGQALILCLVSVLFPTAVAAQSTNATLTGRVADPNKAMVPKAHVTAVNTDTNVKYETFTNESGVFTVPNLPPGPYRLEIEKQGFKTIVETGILLHVQDTVQLNYEMALGSTTESVTVTAEGPNLNTADGSVSTVVDRRFVENIPLNGRSFQTLLTLTPGVVLTKSAFFEQGQFSVNGQRPDANYFTVDGVSANIGVSAGAGLAQSAGGALPGLTALGGTNSLVSVDAMQEFRIQTSSFAPEFGRTPGGQISIATRPGTNEFHGTAFEYFRNDVLDANDWFANATAQPKPKERQNDFGGVFGGPVVKNRTFFFFSYEGLRLLQPLTQVTVVPSLASRQAAPPQIQPLLNAYPLPNGSNLANGFAQFAASYSSPSNLNSTSIRIDQRFGHKVTLFGRYNNAPSENVLRGTTCLSGVRFTRMGTRTITVGSTQSFGPRLINEILTNYSKTTGRSTGELDNFGGATPPSDSVLFPSFARHQNSFFSLFVSGAGSWIVGKNAENEQHQLNVVDNLSWIAGTHQMKFGVDYRRLTPLSGLYDYGQSVVFSGITGTTGALSGNAQTVVVTALQSVELVSSNFSVYGQDTWKVAPRLTLMYGLRWDVNPPPRGKNGKQLFALLGVGGDPAALSLAPAGTPLYQTTHDNFAPRVGLAYQMRQRPGRDLLMRGGFGVFYDLGSGNLGTLTTGFPFSAFESFSAVPFPLTSAQAAPPTFSLTPPVGFIAAADPALKLPRIYQWNLALEQSLGANQTLSATYLGATGRRLLRSEQFLRPNANFTSTVVITRNTGSSDYHALQLQFKRRLSHGVEVLASYSWSHSVDTASSDSGIFAAARTVDPALDRGSSDFDVRHSFTLALSYDIPAPRIGSVGRALLGDWSVDTFVLARSATPVDLIGALNPVGFFASVRPDVIPGVPLDLFDPSFAGGKRFNRAAFQAPAAGRQGTFGRNVLRGFSVWQTDFALRRQFRLTERVALQFRAEFFNILNHPNFADPINDIRNPNFGRSAQMLGPSLGAGGANGGFNPLYQIGGPRSIQFALKLKF